MAVTCEEHSFGIPNRIPALEIRAEASKGRVTGDVRIRMATALPVRPPDRRPRSGATATSDPATCATRERRCQHARRRPQARADPPPRTASGKGEAVGIINRALPETWQVGLADALRRSKAPSRAWWAKTQPVTIWDL